MQIPEIRSGKTAKTFMRKYHFQVATIFLLLLSVIAFSDNLFTDVGQKSNSDPKFIIHGLLMFAWFGILVVQANFIRAGNVKAHIRWGTAGMLIGLAVFISTIYVFVQVYKGWEVMPYFVKANRIFMFSFAVLLVLAWLNRRNGVKHKRYIYLSSLLILAPILDRVAAKLHIDNVDFFNLAIWNLLFIALFRYDWVTLRKIHTISWVGVVWFYVVWALSLLI